MSLYIPQSFIGSYRRWHDRLERSRHPNAATLKISLPSPFCDYPFVNGIVMLLQSDLNQVVIKAMELLYHHWDLLHDTHRHAFMQVMMSGEGCNRLFLHWDMSVRQFFYYLVVYRLLKGSQSDRKGRVDVYAFMREFSKGR